jgi:hypothetical protein
MGDDAEGGKRMTFAPTGGESDYFYIASDTVHQFMPSTLHDIWEWDPPRQPMPYTQPKQKEVRNRKTITNT